MNTPSPHPADTGIFTLWYSCNYGAILTTFALYRLLEQEGLRPLLLDQAPLIRVPLWNHEGSISRAFMQRHGLQCSAPLQTDAGIQRLNEKLQTFIVGSDQVWRWQYTQPYGLLHFLDFVRGDKRKIAVSSSFGIDSEERPADSIRKAGYYLRSFDAVSVREKSGAELLRRHYGVEGEWILDPVFLCETKCYDELMPGTNIPREPYLLSYVLEPDEKIQHLIETIATERGLEVINMVDAQQDFETLRSRFGGIGNISQGVSPEQWVAYIRHCAFFVTDSFHGVCFAHLYHRPFLCVAPPERGLTRFTSLLELTGLQRCLLTPGFTEEERQTAMSTIHWEHVQNQLDTAITHGRSWLHTALATPRDKRTQDFAQAIHELVYAGNGASERHRDSAADLQRRITRYQTQRLPREIRIKMRILRLLAYCPIPSLRASFRRRLQTLSSLHQYLCRDKEG